MPTEKTEIRDFEARAYNTRHYSRDTFEAFARRWAPDDMDGARDFYYGLHQIMRASFADAHELAAKPMHRALKAAFSPSPLGWPEPVTAAPADDEAKS